MKNKIIKDVLFTIVILLTATILSFIFQHIFDVTEHISTIFVFAVFLISCFTTGYKYGVVSAILSAVLINIVFTFPYFNLSFSLGDVISTIIMIVIAVFTCTITTRMKRIELLRAEDEKERMRANLLRAVSHDLRTPLTTIYGSTTALIENRSNLNDDQVNQMLKGIKDDSQWLMRMVENLLSITRINDGSVKIIKTPISVDELIDSVVINLKKRYPNWNLELNIPNEIVMVLCDPILIEQVILNLLENSIIHGKDITVLMLNVTVKDSKAVFEIIDDGCGIDEAKLELILSGKQIKNEEVSDGVRRNSGIGLSVCKTIVKAHNGEFYVHNNETKGATFGFILDMEIVEDE